MSKHKHLGVFLQFDAQWASQIRSLVRRSSRRLAIMRSYAKKFNRTTLMTIYTSFVRPILEYCSELMSNMTEGEKEELEELNRTAIRIITGAKLGTSHQYLYREVDLKPLETKRHKARMVKFVQIKNCKRKLQLNSDNITLVSQRNLYPTRRSSDNSLHKANTEQMKKSYLPTAINEWNRLKPEIQELNDKTKLKMALHHRPSPPTWFNDSDNRINSINITRLRCSNSNL